MSIDNIRNKINGIITEYIKEWKFNNPDAPITEFINENQKIKKEVIKELNTYDNKIVLKTINKEIIEKIKKKEIYKINYER